MGSRILHLKHAIEKASEYRQNNNRDKLREDIINAPITIWGPQKNCESYFCTCATEVKNYLQHLKESGILFKIMETINCLSQYAKSSLYHVNNNAVEQFNAIMKHIGGKQIFH